MNASADLLNMLRVPKPTSLKPPGFRPSYVDLERVFMTYRKGQDLRPGDNYVNECAVRLSIALSLNGFSFERFPDKKRLKNGGQTGIPVPHVYGAEELANYLKREWGPPLTFDKKAVKIAQGVISGRRGVIYFNNCSGQRGDHIDLWTGMEFYNQIMGISAHAGYSTKRNLFLKSDKIYFWEIR